MNAFIRAVVLGTVLILATGCSVAADLGAPSAPVAVVNVAAVQRAGIVAEGPATAASTLPDALQAATVLAAYTLLFIALAYWRLRSRDVTLS